MSSTETNSSPELEISVLPSGIYVYKLSDWSYAGLEQWESSLSQRLDTTTENIFSIYDMRHFETVSPRGFEFVNRLEAHPKSSFSYSVAVLKSRRLAILIDAIIGMRRNNGRNRIFFSMDDAVEWLQKQQGIGKPADPPTSFPPLETGKGLSDGLNS